jgi:hypothetical protein
VRKEYSITLWGGRIFSCRPNTLKWISKCWSIVKN